MKRFGALRPLLRVRSGEPFFLFFLAPVKLLVAYPGSICLSGNIAIGNLHMFLPAIVKLVQTDVDKRLLALHALKEVM